MTTLRDTGLQTEAAPVTALGGRAPANENGNGHADAVGSSAATNGHGVHPNGAAMNGAAREHGAGASGAHGDAVPAALRDLTPARLRAMDRTELDRLA
ncbi:MAG TPA: hypothetical protein VKR78_02690, partial [Acidimicrobiales bacterium]|nr:hypothetical protein [Acidimicrobiales bacterium]